MNAVIHGTRQIEPGTITNASIAAAAAIEYSKLAALTPGSIAFAGASGTLTQDNAKLFWDDSNNALGVGTNAPDPGVVVTVTTPNSSVNGVLVNGPGASFGFQDRATATAWVLYSTIDIARLRLAGVADLYQFNTSGVIGLGGSVAFPSGTNGIVFADGTAFSSMGSNTAGLYANDVSGTVTMFAINEAGVTGAIAMTSAALTAGSVVFAGSTGLLTQDNANLFWDDTNNSLRIVTDGANSALTVTGNAVSFSRANTANSTQTGSIYVYATDVVAADKGGLIYFGGKYTGTTATNFAGIGGFKENAIDGEYGGYLSLYSRTHGSIPSEHVRITAAGRVGVGTTNPAEKLEVAGNLKVVGNITATVGTVPSFTGYTRAIAVAAVDGAGSNVSLEMTGRRSNANDNFAVIEFKHHNGTATVDTTAAIAALRGTNYDDGRIVFYTALTGGALTEQMRIDENGRVGIGTNAPTALLHLKAGTATANTAPLKFTSGTLLGTAEAGALEFLTDDYFATITTGAARKAFVLDDGARLTSGKIPVATTNGRLIDGPTWGARQTYTETNVSTDRAFDANSTTLDEIADVLGTLIADLRAKNMVA